ncbi:MAG: mechanosensitive ion channel family protein [Deltaproteobacteria bacterium]|nr:mechanosensitive ion channel family protein [Deltaproteobacteria bacterium]
MDPRLLVNLLVVVGELAAVVAVTAAVYGIARFLIRRFARLFGWAGGAALADTVCRNVKGVLILAAAAAVISLAVGDGLLMRRGVDLVEHGREWLARIPSGFWLELALAVGKVVGAVAAVTLLLRILRRWLLRGEQAAKAFEQIQANDEAVHAFFQSLEHILTNSAWLLVLAFSARSLRLPAAVPGTLDLLLKIYLIAMVGLVVVKAIAAIVDSLDALSRKYSSPDNLLRFYDRLRVLIPLLKRCLEYIVYVWAATLVVMQVEFIASLAEHGPRVVRIIGIVFIARVVIEVANLGVDELLLKRVDPTVEAHKRRMTFVPLLRSFLKYSIYFGAAVAILKEVGINPTPILAGVGIAGLAVGLGAQNLINDLVSGFFILFENHFLVGDYVEIGTSYGTVEAIDIRTTRIRSPNGQLHILRNGQIGEVVNFSKEYTHAVVEVGVAYESDLGKVYRVLEEVGASLAREDPDVLAATNVQGLQSFGESELVIRTVTRVKPGKHMGVARKLRRKVKEAFEREGVEIPYARRVLIVKDEQAMKRLADAVEGEEGTG